MSEERKSNLVVGVENQTKAPLQEIRQDAASTASSVEQSGKRMAKGMEGLGEGAQKSAKGFDGSTRSIIGSIQRATAAIEAGEKGTSKYFETLAKQRNIGGDVLEPYLAQMRKAEAAQAASIKSMGGMEISAKQTAAALRGVPAQFTDIFVSLQGGQAPLTVLLQQGGQLKDMFGGVGAAAKALGGYVLGLVNPYTLAAGAIGALAIAYNQGSKEQDAFVRSIVLTGNASGVTAGQLRAYAREISDVSGTQAKAAEGLAAFAAAGVRGGEELKRYTQTAIEWEKATGQAIEKTAEQFASLQKDPLAAVLKLNDGTNFLTASVYEQIKALEQQGDKAGAAKVAMDALNSAMKERSAEIRQSLGYIESAWAGITGAAKKAWDAMLNVGRPATLEDQLVDVQKRLDTALANQSWGETGEGAATGRVNEAYRKQVQENIKALTEQKAALLGKIDAERLNAVAQAESARLTQARTDFDKKYGDALKEQISLHDKLARARKEAEAAGKSEAEITKVLAWVTEEHNKANKKGVAGRKESEASYQSLVIAIKQSIAASENELKVGEKLTEAQKLRNKYEHERDTRKRTFTAQEKANIEALLLAAEAAEKQAQAAKELAKAWEDDAKVYDTHIKKQEALVASIYSSVDKLRLEEEGHMLAASANISHSEAMERLTIARLEEAKAQMLQGAGSEEEIERINREIAARKELLGLFAQREAREANKKAADEAAKDWERTSRTISDTLADYIMGGGKDAAQYLKRLFATLVLQPVVNYGVQGVMGALGIGKTGAAAGSVLGGNNVGTTILNNAGLIGAGFQAMYGMSVGASSASLAAANAVGMVGGDALGALIAGNGAWAGVAVEAGATAGAAAGAAAAEGAAAGAAGAAQAGGFMSGVAAAAPYVAAAVALYSIVKSFDDSGTPHTGAGAIYKDGAVSGGKSIFNGANFDFGAKWSEKAQSSVTAIAGGLGSSLDSVATAFGKKAGYSIYTAFADDSSGDGAWGSLKIADAVGNVLVNWQDTRRSRWAPKEFADGEEGYKQYLTAIASDVKSAFMAMDLPAWADNILAAATDLDTLNAALSQIAVNKAGFDALAASMSMFKGISEELQTQLLATAGSMDTLTSVVGSYYGSSLFSERERMLTARQQQMDALSAMGVYIDPAQGEQAKAAFRSTVEQAMAAGQGELAVKLMAMSASFAQVADYAQEEINSIEQAAQAAADAAADAAAEAAQAIAQAKQQLSQSTISLLSQLPGGSQDALQMQSRLLAEQAAQIWSLGADELQGIILQSSAADIEGYLREAWSYLDTTEAKQALVDLGGQLLEFASQADQAAAQQRGAALAGAWGTMASISGLAAQYTGNAAGLNAQLAVMQGSYATADNPADRLAALQEVITLEQSIWGLQQKQRQSEAQAIQEGIKAAQEQLTAQQNLLRAAQSLGEFASDLFSSEQSGLSTAERQAALQSDYQMLLARAQGGDADAMGQLQGVSRDYLQLAQKTASSEADYSVLSGMVAAQLASVSAIGQASATSQTQRLEDQIKRSQQQADVLSAAQFAVSDQTRVAIESLLTESIGGFQDQLRSMQDLSDLTEQQLTALKQWPAALNGIMSATLVPSIQGIAQSASSSAVSAYVAANAAAEEQRMRRAAELVADQLRQQLAAAQAAAEAAAKAAIASASAAGVTVPAFAAGGLHSGGVRLVGEYGPELEVTGPARYFNAQQTQQMLSGGGNAELVAENRRLQQRVAYLQAHMERVANATERLADMFENVSAGGNSMAVDVMRMRASLVEAV